MQAKFVIHRLAENVDTISSLVSGTSIEQACWKSSPRKWSILEVVNHLADEEVEDFRTRLDLVLHHLTQEWPAINPEAWAVDRVYNTRDLSESLRRFVTTRQESLRWLQSLSTPPWEIETRIAGRDPMQAGRLLASWLAHDWHHIRQMTHPNRKT